MKKDFSCISESLKELYFLIRPRLKLKQLKHGKKISERTGIPGLKINIVVTLASNVLGSSLVCCFVGLCATFHFACTSSKLFAPDWIALTPCWFWSLCGIHEIMTIRKI